MLLSTIFDHLSQGELKLLSIGGSEFGEGITEENYPSIVSFINLALIDLHTKFPLKLESVTIQQSASISKYTISREHAVSNTASKRIKYVRDSVSDPFLDNILKIESVQDEAGETLVLNDPSNDLAVSTPGYNQIQLKYPEDNNALGVTYRATHEYINIVGLQPTNVDIAIPPSLIQPLILYVAHKATLGLEGNVESDAFLGKYEIACTKVDNIDMVNEDNIENTKPETNGWV